MAKDHIKVSLDEFVNTLNCCLTFTKEMTRINPQNPLDYYAPSNEELAFLARHGSNR